MVDIWSQSLLARYEVLTFGFRVNCLFLMVAKTYRTSHVHILDRWCLLEKVCIFRAERPCVISRVAESVLHRRVYLWTIIFLPLLTIEFHFITNILRLWVLLLLSKFANGEDLVHLFGSRSVDELLLWCGLILLWRLLLIILPLIGVDFLFALLRCRDNNNLSTLDILLLSTIQAILDESILFGLGLLLSFICVVQGFRQDSQDDIQEEEGANHDEEDWE